MVIRFCWFLRIYTPSVRAMIYLCILALCVSWNWQAQIPKQSPESGGRAKERAKKPGKRG